MNQWRSLDIVANVASAVASRNPKAALSTLPVVMTFYHTGKGLYFGKIVWLFAIWTEQKTESIYPTAPPEKKILILKKN